MPIPSPKPPPGYKIQALPSFLRDSNRQTKTVSAPSYRVGNDSVIADVNQDKPDTIEVREPSLYTVPINTHESTHVYQFSRNPAFVSNMQKQTQATSLKDFDYGGADGLLKSQLERKTIADFRAEQQAEMVADYQRLTNEALKKRDANALSKITAAYHPFIRQLANIPPKGANMRKMTQQDLTPPAPGVPSTNVAGMPLLPDKLIGGDAELPKNSAVRKMGEVKKFPNGRTGVWDGHGWVAQR